MDKLFKGTVKKAYLVNLTNKEVCILSLILALGISLRLFIYNNYIKYPDHDTYFYIQLAKNIVNGLGNYLPYDFTDVGLLKQPLYSLIIAIFHIFISDWPAAAPAISATHALEL